MSEPLRWDDGALLVLDQRLLPAEETWLRCETPEQVAEAIRTLAVRGAPAIGLAAAYGMALAGDRGRRPRTLLRAARPTGANLAWAVDRALAAPTTRWPSPATSTASSSTADRTAGASSAPSCSRPGDRALTHCNAGALATGGYGTAGGVLRAAWERGRLAQVWVDETRPLLQGARLTAWELGRAGIPHRVVTDSSAGALMAAACVDRVVVGADRIAANGDVANKVGTYPLAVLAARHDIPFYVAAPLSTLDPATPTAPRSRSRSATPPRCWAARAPAGSDALNLAFDVTPAELVGAMVTEAGVLRAPYAEAIAGGGRLMDAERLLSEARRPLCIGIGGGGDVVGALATGGGCRLYAGARPGASAGSPGSGARSTRCPARARAAEIADAEELGPGVLGGERRRPACAPAACASPRRAWRSSSARPPCSWT